MEKKRFSFIKKGEHRKLNLALYDSLERWDGREIQEGGNIMYILRADSHCCWQKAAQHCKAIILQLKIFYKEEIVKEKQN